jgi:nitric oxide reductase subunit B
LVSSRLRNYFLISVFGSIAIALIGSYYTQKDLPPYPRDVMSENGDRLTGKAQIMAGQQVWQKYGLMDLGSVWGHGTYRGPDFTAQALHNMGMSMREKTARDSYGESYESLDIASTGAVDAVVIDQIKTNRYDRVKDTLTLTPLQEKALLENREFYDNLFAKGDRSWTTSGTASGMHVRMHFGSGTPSK